MARNAKKTADADLGLAILEVLLKPGETLTQSDIAAWCGIKKESVYEIEKRALRKLWCELRFNKRPN